MLDGYRAAALAWAACTCLLPACGQTEGTSNDAGDASVHDDINATDVQPPGPSQKNASMFAPGSIVDYHVTTDQTDWDHMIQSAYKGEEVYIPCRFEFDGEAFEHAAMRLKGNTTDWLPENKLQFVVRFNWYDKKGRFRGLRRVFLEANPNDPSTCRNNLSLHVMREAGAVTPRSNHARLYVNGAFYGLYENIEYVDREFLEDRFAFPDGNLYKNGEFLKTNEKQDDTSDLDAFNDLVWGEPLQGDHSDFYEKIPKLVDMDALLLHVAVEAILPAGDSFWSGGWNYYWYHDPTRGFVILPWDLDDVMSAELAPADADPLTWTSVAAGDLEPHPLWALARENPVWRAQFKDNLGRIEKDIYRDLGGVAKECCARVWPDLAKGPHYAFDKEEFDKDCQYLQDHVTQRSKFIRDWLDADGK
ncbi:MAG: hypothetical protein GXP54_08820 [Deltaproteobacteria bacterium]|nr:hypothetical protein [Deltaproteobacteria bacterium]